MRVGVPVERVGASADVHADTIVDLLPEGVVVTTGGTSAAACEGEAALKRLGAVTLHDGRGNCDESSGAECEECAELDHCWWEEMLCC